MQTQNPIQIRRQKGQAIAQTQKVAIKDGIWMVPSQSNPEQTYKVVLRIDGSECTCKDYVSRGLKCKHIWAVELTVEKQVNADGTTTITKTQKVTYPQDWTNYTKAQNEEGRLFKVLLKALVENIPEEPYVFGRPRYPLKEALFCAIDKVYSMQSSRRAYSRYKDAESKAQIGKAPNYNLINKTLNKDGITPILSRLLMLTAMPLKSIETKFAVDSTGFRTSQFSDYCEKKHNIKKQHQWIKAHLIVGVKTNIVVSARAMAENSADSPQFIPLVKDTANMGFSMQEISADKAYSSRANLEGAELVGAIPFIPFKSNSSGTPHGARIWRNMFHYFQFRQDEFMEHYHLRSNVETTNMAIKAKLGDHVKSKTPTAQTNEVLCKLIAYNITVLIGAMYELKIEPNLSCSESALPAPKVS